MKRKLRAQPKSDSKKAKATSSPSTKPSKRQNTQARKLSKPDDKPQSAPVAAPQKQTAARDANEKLKPAAEQEFSPSPKPSLAAIASANAKVSGDDAKAPIKPREVAPSPLLFNQNNAFGLDKKDNNAEGSAKSKETTTLDKKELDIELSTQLTQPTADMDAMTVKETPEQAANVEAPRVATAATQQAEKKTLGAQNAAIPFRRVKNSGDSTAPGALKQAAMGDINKNFVSSPAEKTKTSSDAGMAPSKATAAATDVFSMHHYSYKNSGGYFGHIGGTRLAASKAVSVGGLLYISDIMRAWNVPREQEINTPAKYYHGQVEGVLKELDEVLKEAGAERDDLVSVKVKLKDSDVGYKPFLEVWNAWIGTNTPPVSKRLVN